MDSILFFDEKLFLFLNQLGSPSFDAFWLLVTHKATNMVVYLLLALAYGKKQGWSTFAFLFIWTLLLVAFTDQLTNAFKYGVGRLRPCHEPGVMELMRLVKHSCGGKFSFFSGHASNSFALATLFFYVYRSIAPRGRFFFYFLAILIAYSRIYVGVHYPLDILFGSIFGLISGTLFWRLGRQFGLKG